MSMPMDVSKKSFKPAKTQKSKTISNDYIKGLQTKHFLLYNVIPTIGTITAIALLWWYPISSVEIGLLIGMWALSMIGMSVGLHRYFAHRAFKTSQTMSVILAILGCMGAQGPVVSWVAVHRRHHEYSDLPGDPHSPNPELLGEGIFGTLRGLWHAHVGWLTNHEYPNPMYYAPELMRDKTISKINRNYVVWIVLGLLIPTILGGIIHGSWIGAVEGLLWGGFVRMFVVDNSILSINSFSHAFGTHPFDSKDQSRNNIWVAIPTFGESWQNNHHTFENSAAIGLKWWQIDLGYCLIWGLEKLGLVWDVKLPTAKMIEAKKLA
ncbi:acyl-CoA desaturase [Moorena producens JHB]|uniref:Hex-5-enoyl-[acyl-carrier protein] acetylenase n=1 Tax=Moorena producens (strain JHB) TaxID=1454205 RepID=JAMB_MOOP1|nr:acyl-CoA desaturase [Moorena producens]AAS98775.1 JamB [Lyngbya majuscula]AOY84951.2 acyl-CoA desaturase [Moorena producens JHB]